MIYLHYKLLWSICQLDVVLGNVFGLRSNVEPLLNTVTAGYSLESC